MKPREKRERLFRHSRPNLRPFELYDGDEYHKDFKILWIAHQKEPLEGVSKDIDEAEFKGELLGRQAEILIVEDKNKQFDGFGPVGVFWLINSGWKIEPHVSFFPWATKRNKLRSAVSFLQWARNSRKVGCVFVITANKWRSAADRVCSYGVLHYVGKLKNGNPTGDDYIYSVKGKKRG